jgi:hypothetical protein
VINQSEGRPDFYAVKYASFGSEAAAGLRRDVFGEDIGQEGWSTAAEYAEIADSLGVGRTELDIRTASGFFLFVPPGLNEAAIAAADLTVLRVEDRTAGVAEIGARMHAARIRHAAVLERQEGADGFRRRQDLYAMASDLAKSRRLSRFLYVAAKSDLP